MNNSLKNKQNDFIDYLNQKKITFELMYKDGQVYGFLLENKGYYNIKLKFSRKNGPILYVNTQNYYNGDNLTEFYSIINEIHELFLEG